MVTIHPERIELATSGRAVPRGSAPAPAASSSLPASLVRSGLVATGLANAGLLSGGELRGREEARETVASGFAAVDALLPAGGLRRGSLVEWLTGAEGPAAGDATSGAGAVSLAVAVACRLAAAPTGPRTIVLIDRGGWFHPPAVQPWLADSHQLVVARPSHDDDEIWAIDQALRCRGVAAVVAWPRGVAGHSVWGSREPARAGGRRSGVKAGSPWTTALRRWQLAARSSGAIGLLVRPAAAIREPSWAEARIAVSPLPGGTLLERRLKLTKVGGSWSGGLEGHTAETMLDLCRGCEGRSRRESIHGFGPPQHRERSSDWSIDIRDGGLSCRAS